MELEKSINDKRDYKFYILDNKIKVIIINDSTTELCGCTLTVGTGSLEDNIYNREENISYGLAHFLEHMLFMGSKEYPDENYFMDFINTNGGSTNAFTADVNTTYTFTVNQTAFYEALKIFAGFFKNPLLKEECISREINAVNSEHLKNFNQIWTSRNTYKKLYNNIHPAKSFTTGNLKTLQKKSIREELIEFYERYYNPETMNIVLFKNDKLNDDKDNKKLLELLNKTYGTIRKTDKHIIVKREYGNILQKNKLIKYVPISDVKSMAILYEIKMPRNIGDIEKYKIQPFGFLINLLGHEGENSIHKILSDNGWISDLSCELLCDYDDYGVIKLEISLSEIGYKNKINIIKIILDYVETIKKNLEIDNEHLKKLYYELLTINKLNYDKWTEPDLSGLMTNLSLELLDITNPIEILSYETKLVDYEIIKPMLYDLIKDIKINNISIATCEQKYKDKLKHYDPHYNIEYKIYDSLNDVIMYKKMDDEIYGLPPINKYINDTNILIKGEDDVKPIILREDKIKLLYKFNSSFNIPDVVVTVIFELPNKDVDGIMDTMNYLKTTLAMNSRYSDINTELYLMELTGQFIEIHLNGHYLIMTLYGYTSTIDKMIDYAIQKAIIDKPRNIAFDSAKAFAKETFENFIYNDLQYQVNEMISKKIMKKYSTIEEYLKIIDEIDIDNSEETYVDMLKRSNLTLFITGNITKDHCINISRKFDVLDISPIKVNIKDIDINILYGKNINKKKCKNTTNKNTYVSYLKYITSVRSTTENNDWAKIILFSLLFNSFVSNKFFDEVRTKDQFGYIVYSTLKFKGDVYYKNIFIEFVVQSPTYNFDQIVNRIELFIENTKTYIQNMTDTIFTNIIMGQKTIYKKPFSNILEDSEYTLLQILENAGIYNKRSLYLEILDDFTKEDLIMMANKYIYNNDGILISCMEP